MDTMLPILIGLGSFVCGIVAAVIGMRIFGPEPVPSGQTPAPVPVAPAAVCDRTAEDDADTVTATLMRQREEFEKSLQSTQDILAALAGAVKSLDGAATKSGTTLTTVRQRLHSAPIPTEIAKYQELIIGEVDKIIRSNSELRKELTVAQERIDDQQRVIDCLQTAANTDHLTRVGNRASFDEYFHAACERVRHGGALFALIMIDIDHFKNVNDQYGHVIGDRVLESVANKLRVGLRSTDFLARYGGEEFAVILEKSTLEGACLVAENLRDAVETTSFIVENRKLRLTISLGCALAGHEDDEKTLIARSDAELYKAKKYGRNLVYPRGGGNL